MDEIEHYDHANLVVRAYAVAAVAHYGQRDKIGAPYFTHPSRVARAVDVAGYDDVHQAVALLHDVVEDTDITIEALAQIFPREVTDAVEALTHRPSEPRKDYLARVLTNPIATVVKYFDIEDNTNPFRLELLDLETRERLLRKYRRDLQQLLPGLSPRLVVAAS